jgi:hypothetical protein
MIQFSESIKQHFLTPIDELSVDDSERQQQFKGTYYVYDNQIKHEYF